MQILDIKVLKGPNLWSNYRQKLIVVTLNIKHYENLPSNLLEGFPERLLDLMPSLHEHHCSRGAAGGFLQRLQEGTWLGHVVEHVALELQYLAGMDCTFGRTHYADKKNTYYVIFSYEVANAGVYAAKAAVRIVEKLAKGEKYDSLEEDLNTLRDIWSNEGLGPSTRAIIQEANRRGIPYRQMTHDSLFILGQGVNQKKIWSALTSDTSSIAVDLASDKELTKKILASSYIPVPKGVTIKTQKQLKEASKLLRFPLVIKPVNGNHGRGVTTNITKAEQTLAAFKIAKKISNEIIVEHYIPGFDYRILVVNYKFVAIAKRKPASVVGDGESTIQQLIDKINLDPNRGKEHDNFLTEIVVDDITMSILEQHQLSLDSVLPFGKEQHLKYTANLSSGGTSEDVTDQIHPKNIFLFERIARLLNLNLCGIDLIAKDICIPITEDSGAILEVNASPGLRMHLFPEKGSKRNVAKAIVDLLYPEGKSSRIPITAITGTNGKTTTARLIAHFARNEGYNVGLTTTDGIYINEHLITKGDCSGPNSANVILQDPLVDFAVFECARGGILNQGLGFDKSNISIVTNITEDHLGLKGIESIEDLREVKSIVARSTFDDGYAILNADDDLVYTLKEELHCNVALFSIQNNNLRIQEHCNKGGIAAYIEDNKIVVNQGEFKSILAQVKDIPLTHGGTAPFMTQNILCAVLAGILHRFDILNITRALKNFLPTPDNTPGRMNLFDIYGVKVLVDYAHNTAAFIELQKYFCHIPSNRKIGILGCPGDRRPEDIKNVGFYAAQIFDEIIIRHDEDGRGKTNEEITNHLKTGIESVNPALPVTIISNEIEAIEHALKQATPGHFIAYFPEDIFTAIELLGDVSLKYPSKVLTS